MMPTLLVTLSTIPCLLLLLLVFLPASAANSQVSRLVRLVTTIAGLNAVAAIGAFAVTLFYGAEHLVLFTVVQNLPVTVSFYVDGISSLMLMLVASVGWVICRFSVRYLDGESGQGNYFRWTGFTIGAVSVFVVAGNLALMVVALLLTSIGLHQLLVHYNDRPAARRAAAIKFIFSRLGDVFLIAAGVLLFKELGTLELPQLFSAVGTLDETAVATSSRLAATGWLLVLCAVFKSAQFPFHTWLPETMEAPTPVSALMHAGIINAGGYLLIRTAPIVSLVPAAMWAVAGLGAFTAIFAALVMLTQTSVKRSLAWSTIAQMGFMMLQCGLGAFSAAMLHIIAHSLYKAHAFLSSGSVMSESYAMTGVPAKVRSAFVSVALFCVAAAVTAAMFVGTATSLGISLQSKPGGFLLGFILCLGLTRWQWQMLLNGPRFLLRGVATSVVLICAYLVSFSAVHSVVAGSSGLLLPVDNSWLMIATASVFAGLMLVELLTRNYGRSAWMHRLYVHSSNGFYVDTVWIYAAKSFLS